MRRPWDLGAGTVHVLEKPDELDRLAPRLRRLVSDSLAELWRGFPGSLERIAARTSVEPFASWLCESAAQSEATLAVYDLPSVMPKRALLELDFGLRETRGGPQPWRVLLDGQLGRPPRCPAALAEVYEAVGGLATQYGASGTLITPAEVVPLADRGAEVAHLLDPELDGELDQESAREWYPWFESDGDYLCYRRDGQSRWFGFEWGASGELRPTSAYLEELFRCLLAKEYFHA